HEAERAAEISGGICSFGERARGDADAFFAFRPTVAAMPECHRAEERPPAVAESFHRSRRLVTRFALVAGDDEQRPFDVARELLEPIGAGARAEVLRGDIFELVRFVEDGAVASGDHLAVIALSDSRISAQQV